LLTSGDYRTTWDANETFAGDSLNIGSHKTSSIGTNAWGQIKDNHKNNHTFTFKKLVFWHGRISNITASDKPGSSTYAGNLYIKASKTEGCDHQFSFNGSNARNFIISMNIFGDENYGVLTLLDSTGVSLASLDAGNYGKLILSGDNSGYKGSFVNNDSFATLVLKSATAIGDSDTPNAAAVQLANDAAFAIDGAFEQNVSRGIQLTGAEAYFVTLASSCNSYTVKYPVSKEQNAAGKLLVRGPGRITLDCAYTAGDIEVQSGTLVLGENLTLPSGLKIHVCAGATLLQRKAFSGVTVTSDSTGVVAVEVPYDTTTRTATPLAMTANEFNALLKNPDGSVAVVLTSAIPIPFTATNELEVIRITEGVVVASAVKDASPKTYGLPTTWIESHADENGQLLKLLARPALSRANVIDKNVGGADWSDGQKPHAGADYYAVSVHENNMRLGSGSNQASFTFNGESLTCVNNGFRHYVVSAVFNDLRLLSGALIDVQHGNANQYMDRNLSGNLFIGGSVADSTPIRYRFDSRTPKGGMDAKLTGGGSFRYEGTQASMPLYLRNNADDFTGHLLFSGSMQVVVGGKDDTVFGGALATQDAKAVQVYAADDATNLQIIASEDLTVSTANRGWMIGKGSLGATAGKTFIFCPPSLTVTNTLAKTGAGTLAMGCATSAAGATFLVKEGALMPKSGSCCDTFDAVDFAAEAELAIDVAETDAVVKAKGLIAKRVTVAADGKLRIGLRNWRQAALANGVAVAAVLTVPETEPDLTDAIELVGRGAIKKLTSSTKDGFTTYTAEYSVSGMRVILQ